MLCRALCAWRKVATTPSLPKRPPNVPLYDWSRGMVSGRGSHVFPNDRPISRNSSGVNPTPAGEKRPRRVTLRSGKPAGSARVPSSKPAQSRPPPG